jgi:hypothetical protein
MNNYFNKMVIKKYKLFFAKKSNIYEFTISVISLILILIILSNFLLFIELRNGFVLNDLILSIFQPLKLTWLIFSILYLGIISAPFDFGRKPEILLIGIQSYVLMIIFRIILMSFIPLDPPSGMIPLIDPVVEIFATGKTLTKDLFFSGHTATMFLLFLLVNNKFLKLLLLIGTIVVGLAVIIQHVHYTIDVIFAPVFSYLAYYIIRKIKTLSGSE